VRMRWTATVLAALAAATVPEAGAAASALQVPQPTLQDSTYGCLMCHAEKRRSFSMGVHSEHGMRCDDCHGGNPNTFDRQAAHRGQFLGRPDKRGVVRLCSSCHSDANRMRQFGLPSDQLAEFRTSRHGQLLLGAGNEDAPTCTDCHDAHTILPPDDARSSVHPLNIPSTCARCHEDPALMAKYGIPTDQFEQYRASAHGIAVFEKENFAAPTCMGCHGSHAALPPGVRESVNVCEKCHVQVGRAFNEGPHWQASQTGALPGCLACHSNHGTERVPPDGIASVCANCHEPDGRPGLLGSELQARVVRAAEDLAAADRAIEELRVSGHQVGDERFRYQTALTNYQRMSHGLHSFDLELLDDLARRVRSNTELVRARAEARAEGRWEHKLMLVPVWFLALAALVFAWFKLRDLSDGIGRW